MTIPWKVKALKDLCLRNAYSLNLEREYNAGTSLRHPSGMKMYAELARTTKRKKLGIKSLNGNKNRSKHEIVMNGYLGNILGTQIHTDGFRYETLKVLEPGECYFLGAPANLGAITRRKDLSTAPINLHLLGRPERG